MLARIADDDRHLGDIFDLDDATNERVLAEGNLLPGIGLHELVFGVPCCRMVNAAFTHAHPLGRRFNGPDRGAWYSAFEIETSQAEVAFHKTVQLAEIERFVDDVTCDDFLSDISAELGDIRMDEVFADSLAPESYVASQGLAERLLEAGALGIIYPSVRHAGGTCVASFRPAIVTNVRKGGTWRFLWDGDPRPQITSRSE